MGWMVLSGDKSHVKDYIEGLNMLSSMRLCSNVLSQQIVQTALGGYQSSDELLLPGGRIYEQRAFIYKAINDIPGLSAVKPKAAFYIFPKIDIQRFNITNDEQFVLDFFTSTTSCWFTAVGSTGNSQIISESFIFLIWKT